MPRKTPSLEAVSKEITAAKRNNKLYKPEKQEEDNKISNIIGQKMLMLSAARERGKVNLRSLEEVESAAFLYLETCRKNNEVPNFEGLAVFLGYCRQNLYYIVKSRNDEVSEFLDLFRSLCADIVQSASSKRIIDNATSIFILKSMTGLGFTDKNDEMPEMNELSEDYGSGTNYKEKYRQLIGE